MHPNVQPVVKVSPHVRVEVDAPDALGRGGGVHAVDGHEGAAEAEHYEVLHVEQLGVRVAEVQSDIDRDFQERLMIALP